MKAITVECKKPGMAKLMDIQRFVTNQIYCINLKI